MWTLERLIKHVSSGGMQTETDGKWIPARPEIYHSWWHQFKDAWEVFRGRADAVKWPGGQ